MDNVELINNDDMSTRLSTKKKKNQIHVGDENRGYRIVKCAHGVVPANVIKLANSAKKFHANVGDGSINSEEEGILRSEQQKVLNGIEVELVKATRSFCDPLDELKKEFMDIVRPIRQENTEKKELVGGSIAGWVQRSQQRIDDERIIKERAAEEVAERERKEKDRKIAIAKERFDKSEKERLAKIAERQDAERNGRKFISKRKVLR